VENNKLFLYSELIYLHLTNHKTLSNSSFTTLSRVLGFLSGVISKQMEAKFIRGLIYVIDID
jgi:hypothetical protein